MQRPEDDASQHPPHLPTPIFFLTSSRECSLTLKKSSTNIQLRTQCLTGYTVLQPQMNSAFTFTHQKRRAFLIKAEQHQSLNINIIRKAFAATCKMTEVDLPVGLMTSAAMDCSLGLPVQGMASL